MEGLATYVRYFVEECRVNESLFEGKLSCLTMAFEEMCIIEDNRYPRVATYSLNSIDEPKPLEAATPGYNNIIDLTTTPELESPSVWVGLDSFEFEDSLGPTKASAKLCKGYILSFSNGKSPNTSYPFALHNTLILPWDYSLQNGVMTLFSLTCVTFVDEGIQSCRNCQYLRGNEILEKILMRINKGIHENAGHAYYGFSALSEVLHRRTQQLRISELRGLNQAKKLLSKATVLSDQKRLLMAIASGKVNRVDCILSIGLRQKKSTPPRGYLSHMLLPQKATITRKASRRRT